MKSVILLKFVGYLVEVEAPSPSSGNIGYSACPWSHSLMRFLAGIIAIDPLVNGKRAIYLFKDICHGSCKDKAAVEQNAR